MLRFERVNKRYDGRMIVREIDLELTAGLVAVLAGPNGAGKSTLLRLAAGLTPPSSGSVRRDDAAVIGYMGHTTGIYPHWSALDNLAFWQKLHQADARTGTLLAALDRVGLARRARDRAGSFSRGMAQRLNLARLLLLAPDLLLLDEPDTGLDTDARALLHDEIILARQRGAAVLWVSHDPARDALLADRLLELHIAKGGARLEMRKPTPPEPREGHAPSGPDDARYSARQPEGEVC